MQKQAIQNSNCRKQFYVNNDKSKEMELYFQILSNRSWFQQSFVSTDWDVFISRNKQPNSFYIQHSTKNCVFNHLPGSINLTEIFTLFNNCYSIYKADVYQFFRVTYNLEYSLNRFLNHQIYIKSTNEMQEFQYNSDLENSIYQKLEKKITQQSGQYVNIQKREKNIVMDAWRKELNFASKIYKPNTKQLQSSLKQRVQSFKYNGNKQKTLEIPGVVRLALEQDSVNNAIWRSTSQQSNRSTNNQTNHLTMYTLSQDQKNTLKKLEESEKTYSKLKESVFDSQSTYSRLSLTNSNVLKSGTLTNSGVKSSNGPRIRISELLSQSIDYKKIYRKSKQMEVNEEYQLLSGKSDAKCNELVDFILQNNEPKQSNSHNTQQTKQNLRNPVEFDIIKNINNKLNKWIIYCQNDQFSVNVRHMQEIERLMLAQFTFQKQQTKKENVKRFSKYLAIKECEDYILYRNRPLTLKYFVLIKYNGDVYIYDEFLIHVQIDKVGDENQIYNNQIFNQNYTELGDMSFITVEQLNQLVYDRYGYSNNQDFYNKYIEAQIIQAVQKCVDSCKHLLIKQAPCVNSFDLLEFDFQIRSILDSYKIYIQNVESCPFFQLNSCQEFLLYPKLIDDVYDLTIDQYFSDPSKKYFQKNQNVQTQIQLQKEILQSKNSSSLQMTDLDALKTIKTQLRRIDAVRFTKVGREINQFQQVFKKWLFQCE